MLTASLRVSRNRNSAFAGARRCLPGSNGEASEQGFGTEGEVQESPGAGNVSGKFEAVGGQADRVCHHCRNTQGVRTDRGKGGGGARMT